LGAVCQVGSPEGWSRRPGTPQVPNAIVMEKPPACAEGSSL